ncbi:MAG: hypothetical protein JRJ62_15455 [Deltaproteobacteria bacterium]|nr:hypothetical protein [Deltaproteobacteria bacterium]
MTKIDINVASRIRQGDIYRDVKFIESAEIRNGVVSVTQILFPLVIVLTQDCDLESNMLPPKPKSNGKDNAALISVLVAPIYNFEHFRNGEHLKKLNLDMEYINSKQRSLIQSNENKRYHFLEFTDNINIIPMGVIDFKHYFSVTTDYLKSIMGTNFVCHIVELYREDVSQRFAAFLSRIGLPNMVNTKCANIAHHE